MQNSKKESYAYEMSLFWKYCCIMHIIFRIEYFCGIIPKCEIPFKIVIFKEKINIYKIRIIYLIKMHDVTELQYLK